VRSAEHDVTPERYAALVAPLVDRAFVAGMRAPRERGGRAVAARHGGPSAVWGLVEFRTSLAWPGRVVTGPQWRAVWRYRSVDDGVRWIAERAAAGTLEPVEDGFRAAPTGLAFLHDAYAAQDEVLEVHWGAAASPLLAPLSTAAAAAPSTGGLAYAAMTPTYEPAGGWRPGLRVLDLLTALRYHRSDAHAAAWAADGLTAAGIAALTGGPRRDAIEAETNRRAAPPWGALTPPSRTGLLDALVALPG
jgi:hypothetical protein